MVNFAQVVRDHWVHILVPLGFVVGCYLDRMNDEKLSTFRNKSLLYRRSALIMTFKYVHSVILPS
uniref:NADH dehydrogenase [ubiquinone] 1 beta subcomplex subunit 1 n=1 Tax=Anas platyrhynchos platyrhynchos TaxID=8840 RepID=U3IEA7_ANAPP